MSKAKPTPVDVPDTGHEWDGIKEFDNPLPRWWLYIFYASVVWSIGSPSAPPPNRMPRRLPSRSAVASPLACTPSTSPGQC